MKVKLTKKIGRLPKGHVLEVTNAKGTEMIANGDAKSTDEVTNDEKAAIAFTKKQEATPEKEEIEDEDQHWK